MTEPGTNGYRYPEKSLWKLGFPQLGGGIGKAETCQEWSLTWRLQIHL